MDYPPFSRRDVGLPRRVCSFCDSLEARPPWCSPPSLSLLSLSLLPSSYKALGLLPSPSGLLRVPGLLFPSFPSGQLSAKSNQSTWSTNKCALQSAHCYFTVPHPGMHLSQGYIPTLCTTSKYVLCVFPLFLGHPLRSSRWTVSTSWVYGPRTTEISCHTLQPLTRTASFYADSTCDSVVVSGVGDLDGTYTLQDDASDNLRPLFERVTGTEVYTISWNGERWGIYDSSSYSYRVRPRRRRSWFRAAALLS